MLLSKALEYADEARAGRWNQGVYAACVALADELAAAGKVVDGRVYIAGPMTGIPELNFPAFHAAAAELRAKHYDVINPAELVPYLNPVWTDAMRVDIRELMTCTHIFMLDGWRQSRGASLEYFLANALNLTILNERPGLTVAAAAMAVNIPQLPYSLQPAHV